MYHKQRSNESFKIKFNYFIFTESEQKWIPEKHMSEITMCFVREIRFYINNLLVKLLKWYVKLGMYFLCNYYITSTLYIQKD